MLLLFYGPNTGSVDFREYTYLLLSLHHTLWCLRSTLVLAMVSEGHLLDVRWSSSVVLDGCTCCCWWGGELHHTLMLVGSRDQMREECGLSGVHNDAQ